MEKLGARPHLRLCPSPAEGGSEPPREPSLEVIEPSLPPGVPQTPLTPQEHSTLMIIGLSLRVRACLAIIHAEINRPEVTVYPGTSADEIQSVIDLMAEYGWKGTYYSDKKDILYICRVR